MVQLTVMIFMPILSHMSGMYRNIVVLEDAITIREECLDQWTNMISQNVQVVFAQTIIDPPPCFSQAVRLVCFPGLPIDLPPCFSQTCKFPMAAH